MTRREQPVGGHERAEDSDRDWHCNSALERRRLPYLSAREDENPSIIWREKNVDDEDEGTKLLSYKHKFPDSVELNRM